MIKLSIALFSFFITLHSTFAAVPGEAFRLDEKQGKISFLAVGRPSAIKIRGEGAGASGELTKKGGVYSGNLEFDLNSLQTGINMRDEHMKKKYLNTETYPKAVLKITSFSAPMDSELPFQGDLTLKGETHAVAGKAKISQGVNPQAFSIHAQFPLKLGEFKIEIPKYAGISVAEDVEVSVDATALRKK